MSLIDGGFLLRHLADSETVQARRLKVQAESPAAPPPPNRAERSAVLLCYGHKDQNQEGRASMNFLGSQLESLKGAFLSKLQPSLLPAQPLIGLRGSVPMPSVLQRKCEPSLELDNITWKLWFFFSCIDHMAFNKNYKACQETGLNY